MTNRVKTSIAAGLCVVALLLQSCTKEKAEAVKVAAQNFRAEAAAALGQIRDILKQDIALPPTGNDKLAGDLAQTNFTYEMLQMLLQENQIGVPGIAQIDKKFADAQKKT